MPEENGGSDAPEKPKGPPQEQIDRTLRWITRAYSDYYLENPPPMPPRFGRREFGFRWNGKKFFLRHRGMRSPSELHTFLYHEGPHHCYYSTAYYKDPDQSTMVEKQWLGADLIFDLDADHLEKVEGADDPTKWTYEKQLEEVKRQTLKLVHEFVLGDFGFDADNVRIVFSGGRGYHVHVDDPRVLTMDASSRREVVDYVVGRGIKVDGLVKEHTAAVSKGFQGRAVKEKALVLPRPDDPAWAGRWARGVHGVIQEMVDLGDPRAVARYASNRGITGVGEKTAQRILEYATREDAGGRTKLQELRETGRTNVDVLMKLARVEELAVRAVNEEKGESDEPVTADVKRLIRLPGSLHGGTGFRVTPITVDGLKDFDPLNDALVMGDYPVRVNVSRPERVRLGDEEYDCEPGVQELPARYALFLCLRRRALLA